MKQKEKCCGNCCWFYGEMTCGDGFCALSPVDDNWVRCDMCCRDSFVSREEMRHHMAVLLQASRWHNSTIAKRPDGLFEAAEFAYKYMKVFSEL